MGVLDRGLDGDIGVYDWAKNVVDSSDGMQPIIYDRSLRLNFYLCSQNQMVIVGKV